MPTVNRHDVETFILGSKLARDLTAAQKDLCIKTALSWGLNPLKREIHFVAYQGQEPKIVVGYDVYIKRAERTAKLDGWKAWVEGSGKDLVAKIIIYRKDWSRPFEHEVYYDEAVQTNYKGEVNATWKKMPKFMLKKVVIGQGFRLCFPEEFGGMPYMAEEIGLDEVVNGGYIEREDGKQTNAVTGEIIEREAVAEPGMYQCEKCEEVVPLNAMRNSKDRYDDHTFCFKHQLEYKKAKVQETRARGDVAPTATDATNGFCEYPGCSDRIEQKWIDIAHRKGEPALCFLHKDEKDTAQWPREREDDNMGSLPIQEEMPDGMAMINLPWEEGAQD
jgi:phage recombination protein Bet